MDFSISDLNYNSVETLPGFEASAAFTVNSSSVFGSVSLSVSEASSLKPVDLR